MNILLCSLLFNVFTTVTGDGKERLIVIPTEKQCYALMDQYQMLDNIREHSIVVADITRVISLGLVNAGVQLSVDRAVAGALLHDIGKTHCLKIGGDHAALGRKICLQHQFDEIADIVGEHIWLKDHPPDGMHSEKEIVYYADKRVLHTSVVSLEERMHDIVGRYGKDDFRLQGLIRENFNTCRGIETKLFDKLGFGPHDLAAMLG